MRSMRVLAVLHPGAMGGHKVGWLQAANAHR